MKDYIYEYGKCESCKNSQNKKFGVIICKKDGKFKKWNNKCYLYKVRRKYLKGGDENC